MSKDFKKEPDSDSDSEFPTFVWEPDSSRCYIIEVTPEKFFDCLVYQDIIGEPKLSLGVFDTYELAVTRCKEYESRFNQIINCDNCEYQRIFWYDESYGIELESACIHELAPIDNTMPYEFCLQPHWCPLINNKEEENKDENKN